MPLSANIIRLAQLLQDLHEAYFTSTVSYTLITPGCLNVRSFRTAFRASGKRGLFARESKVNMLHLEPSS